MTSSTILSIICGIGLAFFALGLNQAKSGRNSGKTFHSLPQYYGLWSACLSFLPAAFLLASWSLIEVQLFQSWVKDFYPVDIQGGDTGTLAIALTKVLNHIDGIIIGKTEDWVITASNAWINWAATSALAKSITVIAVSIGGGLFGYRQINTQFRARNGVEKIISAALIISSTIAILTTLGIIVSVLFETIKFFERIPMSEFLFSPKWNPVFEGGGSSSNGISSYGMLPLLVGTLLISTIAIGVAVPVGLAAAVYLAEYASPKVRSTVKPLLEILAGVPTVVYGFFAALTVAPFVRDVGESVGLTVSSESALAAGLVMGVMIIPFVSSLSDDVINAVPQALRDAAYGLGSTKSEATRQVVLPAALPGIVAAIILAVSRAIGETMIVVMAAGLAANLTVNPLEAVTTVTAQIVTILVGDQEIDSAKTLAAFALATMLILFTLTLNYIALQIVKKYREQYD